ncbi:histidine kinase [Micromonospora profundi]|uniref:histidine kinase n=1 Tax=Micromonospora profundi TaxID=1420889 RepID=A0AAJ6HP34_9ACTN|nr:histidine kinase [Micromonospora profundi]NJC12648.1 signal transduction histidine kinase [Micromonospora profundi]WLS44480.1 histidine kinase [Micromonospora profundi]
MTWERRLFDARDTLVRMVLLNLSGVGYLVFGTQAGHPPTRTQWILAVAAFTVGLLLHRRPVLNLAAQAALLAVAICLVDDIMINQVGASWALLEVTMRARRSRTIWLAAVALAAVDLTDSIGDPFDRVASGVVGLALEVGVPVLLGLVIRTNRELSRQAVERAAEEQRRHESESRAARADERSAIARELHDVVAHHVASMVLRVGVARHVLTDLDPRVEEVFDDVHGTGTAALSELRRLVAVLRDPDGVRGDAALTAIDPSALPAALGATVDRARRAGITVQADIDPAVGALDAVRGLAVLRLTQEALTNVARHAGPAALAHLTVAVRDGTVHWEVTDDGHGGGRGLVPASGERGGRPPVVPGGGGHGITGMRERVDVLGGRLEVGATETGWRVRAVLPHLADASGALTLAGSVPRDRATPHGSPTPEPSPEPSSEREPA